MLIKLFLCFLHDLLYDIRNSGATAGVAFKQLFHGLVIAKCSYVC